MNLEKMDEFFESRLDGYDRHMLTEIEGAEEFYEFTARLLPTKAGCEILDLGCGTGLELERFFALNPGACVTGIDLSAGMLDALGKKFPEKKLRLIRGSYFDLPFGEKNSTRRFPWNRFIISDPNRKLNCTESCGKR